MSREVENKQDLSFTMWVKGATSLGALGFFIDNLLVRIHDDHRDDFSGLALRYGSLN